jgi:predicted anti-sigma-YlaC factor YlaD
VSAEHDELRRLLGGYLLGGLDDADNDRLDAHLRDCDDCRQELDELAPVPELLKGLPDAQRAEGGVAPAPVSLVSRPSAENIETLLRKMRAERSRESRTARVRWLAAAAMVLVAVAIGFGVVRGGRGQSTPEALPSPQLVTAQFEPAAGSSMTGEATLTPKTWGVSVSLEVTRLQGDGPFLCQVHDYQGRVDEYAATWGPTPTGNAKVIGASSIQLRNVSTITVATRDGHVLGTATVN